MGFFSVRIIHIGSQRTISLSLEDTWARVQERFRYSFQESEDGTVNPVSFHGLTARGLYKCFIMKTLS